MDPPPFNPDLELITDIETGLPRRPRPRRPDRFGSVLTLGVLLLFVWAETRYGWFDALLSAAYLWLAYDYGKRR